MRRRSHRITAACFAARCACLMMVLRWQGAAFAETAAPTLDETRQFIINLEHDYAERPVESLVSRMDENEVVRRILGAHVVREDYRWLTWGFLAPAVRSTLAVLGRGPTFLVARPVRSGEDRLLECGFAEANGFPILVTLTLVRSNYGLVHIADVQVAGEPFSFTTRLRQELLLQNVEVASLRNAEEIDLRTYGSTYVKDVQRVFDCKNRGDLDYAFELWSKLPGGLKDTTYWRYLRTELALAGSQSARTNLEKALRDGEDVNPFVRLRLAEEKNDQPAAMRAVDDILAQNEAPVLYRCIKANLLAQTGHLPEAYDIYRDIVDLTPYTTIAYVGAISAAVQLQRPADAERMLRRWALITPTLQIDSAIKMLPDLAAFRDSDAYLEWLRVSPPRPAAATH